MKILINTWPKSGTHLALELVRHALGPGAWYDDKDLKQTTSLPALLEDLDARSKRHGDNTVVKGHLPWTPDLRKALVERGFKILFVIRDPREVLCSTFRWLRDLRRDWPASRALEALPDDAARLASVIDGVPEGGPLGQFGLHWEQPLPKRYEPITRWLDDADAPLHLLKYEPVSGAVGSDAQVQAVRDCLHFLGVDEARVGDVAAGVVNPSSRTFHSGKPDTWRKLFNENHCRLFVEHGGEALVERFGYDSTPVGSASPGSPNPYRGIFETVAAARQEDSPNRARSTIKSRLVSKLGGRKINSYRRRLARLEKSQQDMEVVVRAMLSDEGDTTGWLWLNRQERMDALHPLFDGERAEFHLDRYRFASRYTSGLDVIDAACGTGYGSEVLKTHGTASSVVGVDIDEQAIQYARNAHGLVGIEYLTSDVKKIDRFNEVVDVVASFETLEHVEDEDGLLEEFVRLLRPGGRLIISTPNEWPVDASPHHVREYDFQSFHDLLAKRFEVEEVFNQNSGGSSPYNRGQPRGIVSSANVDPSTAECLIAVCRKR